MSRASVFLDEVRVEMAEEAVERMKGEKGKVVLAVKEPFPLVMGGFEVHVKRNGTCVMDKMPGYALSTEEIVAVEAWVTETYERPKAPPEEEPLGEELP